MGIPDSCHPETRQSTATRPVLVRCTGLARTFGHDARAAVAVHGSSAVVRAGDQIALTGPSGSGKSTLLHLFAGLDTATRGDLRWPAFRDAPRGPGRIGLVFQGPSLIPGLDVTENITLPLLMADLAPPVAATRAAAALADLDLGHLAHRLPQDLSGGQAQRVAVARALATRPALILADEPTGRLDHVTASHVIGVLLRAAVLLEAALIVSTHDPLVAAQLPRQWRMSDGRLITDVPPAAHGARS